MLAILSLCSAFAATNEVGFEVGWLGNSDPRWGTFAEGRTYGTAGLRVGLKVHERVAIIAGWQHGNTGMTLSSPYEEEVYDEEEDAYYGGGSESLRTAFYGDQFTLGGKADVQLFKWLHPYATVQGVGMRALVRFDDDDGDDENLTQVQRAGVTGGVLATAGLDFPIHIGPKYAISPYVELGYGWLAPVVFKDVGALEFDGFAGRTGVALHF